MEKTRKTCALILTIIVARSCLTPLMVGMANAQTPPSIPAPSIPQFSAQYVGQPYNALVITIKNQPHNPSDGALYYNVRLKGNNIPENDSYDVWQYPLDYLFQIYDTYPEQSTDSDYTNITITAQSGLLPLDTQTDVQVEAMLGGINRGPVFNSAWRFGGQTSNWSDTQTVGVPAIATSTPTITQSITPIPADNSVYLTIISITLTVIAILLTVIAALLLTSTKT
jgi:hypothetical protein